MIIDGFHPGKYVPEHNQKIFIPSVVLAFAFAKFVSFYRFVESIPFPQVEPML
jgi:hypothetical protein